MAPRRRTTADSERTAIPLWSVYCPECAYSAADKQAFAERITDLYAEFGLPRFYVVVLFKELPRDWFYIGGEPTDDFVRISIDQIARGVPEEMQAWWMKRVRKVVAPFTVERGLRWEVHVDETPRGLWMLDGFFPPDEGSEEEKQWARENKPSEPLAGSAQQHRPPQSSDVGEGTS